MHGGEFDGTRFDMSDITDLKVKCKSFMAECGLESGELISDGKIHRYSVDAKKNKPDEWYIASEDVSEKGNPYLICTFGSWSDGSKYTFKSYDNETCFGQCERAHLARVLREQSVASESEKSSRQDEAAKRAQDLWPQYSDKPQSDAHLEYVRQKNIKLYPGIKFGYYKKSRLCLVIPLYNSSGQLRSLQFILKGDDGKQKKRFLRGGEKRGNYHIIGEITQHDKVLFVTEGYATGATVHEAMHMPVVVAFDAGNLEPVICNIKKAFPKSELIIAADNDQKGLEQANIAAKKHNCKVVFPRFPEDITDKTDFNDLCAIGGRGEVERRIIECYCTLPVIKTEVQEQFPMGEHPLSKFSLTKLPLVLREYISSIAFTTSAHPIMITSSVISMISGFLGAKVLITEGEYFQPLYPNLWILCIARSGQFKTTALNKGAKVAYENQAKVFSEIRDARQNSDDARDIEEFILEISKKNIILPTKMTAEAFLEYLAQGHEGTILSSEFGGWLQNLDKNHNNDFKAIMTELFDVPSFYRYKTKTQGDCVLERPFISICGVSTISWVRSNLKPTDVSSGFFARFIIYTPPFKDHIPPALPVKKHDESEIREGNFRQWQSYVLQAIGNGREFTLTGKAKQRFQRYHILIHCVPKICSESVGEILNPYLKRWSPYILKLAIIIQLALDPDSTEITGDAIDIAFHILCPAIWSTIRLFEGELGESAYQRKCRILFEWLKKRVKDKKPVTRQAILASKQLNGGVKEYDIVLQDLVEQGKIRYQERAYKNSSEYFLIEKTEDN